MKHRSIRYRKKSRQYGDDNNYLPFRNWWKIAFWVLFALDLIVVTAVCIWQFIVLPIEESQQQASETSTTELPKISPVATKDELLAEINRRREEAGVEPLEYSAELEKSAQQKCDDMVENEYFGHQDLNGEQGDEIASKVTGWYGTFGENLQQRARINDSATAIFDRWFESDPHKEASLDPSYTKTGFGICGAVESENYVDLIYIVEHFYAPEE